MYLPLLLLFPKCCACEVRQDLGLGTEGSHREGIQSCEALPCDLAVRQIEAAEVGETGQ